MNITEMNKNSVRVALQGQEASLLLQGLEDQRDELGEVAEELIALLRSKGVTRPPAPDHIRMEYEGPE